MSLFELDNGRLVPAQFGHDVPDGFTESIWQALYPQVLQLIERPLFSVTWRDLTTKEMVQNSRGEYEKPALHGGFSNDTNLVGRLTALDAAGQVVAVVLARQLTSNLLIESLSQLADAATLSWSDLAKEYPAGSERFRSDWADFRSAMSVQARSGPRLIFATPKVAGEVRPALDVLASSGVEVHEMSMRRTSSGRIFVECNPVTPRGYNTPLVLSSGVGTDTTMQAVITMVSESASRSVIAGGAVAGEFIGHADRNGTGVDSSDYDDPRSSGNLFSAGQAATTHALGSPSPDEGGFTAETYVASEEFSSDESTDGIPVSFGAEHNLATDSQDNPSSGSSAGMGAQPGNEDIQTGTLSSRRSRFSRIRSSRLGFRSSRNDKHQASGKEAVANTGEYVGGAAATVNAANGKGDSPTNDSFAINSANSVSGASGGADNETGSGADSQVGTAKQGRRLTRIQRRMQTGVAQTSSQHDEVLQGGFGSASAQSEQVSVSSSGQNIGQTSAVRSGAANVVAPTLPQTPESISAPFRTRSESRQDKTFPSRRQHLEAATSDSVSSADEAGQPPRLTRAQMRARAKTNAAETTGTVSPVTSRTSGAYQIAGSSIETADIETIEPGDVRKPVQTLGLANATGLLMLARVLQAETALALPAGWRQTQAFLTTSGTIRLMNGQEYTDPTMALQSLGFADADGWSTWRIGDFEGPTLSEALAELDTPAR